MTFVLPSLANTIDITTLVTSLAMTSKALSIMLAWLVGAILTIPTFKIVCYMKDMAEYEKFEQFVEFGLDEQAIKDQAAELWMYNLVELLAMDARLARLQGYDNEDVNVMYHMLDQGTDQPRNTMNYRSLPNFVSTSSGMSGVQLQYDFDGEVFNN